MCVCVWIKVSQECIDPTTIESTANPSLFTQHSNRCWTLDHPRKKYVFRVVRMPNLILNELQWASSYIVRFDGVCVCVFPSFAEPMKIRVNFTKTNMNATDRHTLNFVVWLVGLEWFMVTIGAPINTLHTSNPIMSEATTYTMLIFIISNIFPLSSRHVVFMYVNTTYIRKTVSYHHWSMGPWLLTMREWSV